MEFDETFLPDEIQIDRMMLESFGIDVSESIQKRIDESSLREVDEKLFGVDSMFVFHIDDVVEDITLRNDAFEYYIDAEIYAKVDSCLACLLLDMHIDKLIASKLKDFINELDKGEILRYDDFFRYLFEDEFIRYTFGEDLSNSIVSNIRYDDGRFEFMPHVVRIF